MLILFSTVYFVAVTINKCLFHFLVHFYKQFLSASLSSPRPRCLVLILSSSSSPHRRLVLVASSPLPRPRPRCPVHASSSPRPCLPRRWTISLVPRCSRLSGAAGHRPHFSKGAVPIGQNCFRTAVPIFRKVDCRFHRTPGRYSVTSAPRMAAHSSCRTVDCCVIFDLLVLEVADDLTVSSS